MNAKDAWMKQVKHNRKRLKGLPRVGFNPNAGNVEHNISMFNTMNSPTGGPSTNPCGPMGEALIEGMSREQMIAQLRELKCNYNFNDRQRFPDNVLWGILQDRLNKAQTKKINTKSKEVSQEETPEEDEPMEIKHCNRCGKQLTDFGQCPVCDLGDEEERTSHMLYLDENVFGRRVDPKVFEFKVGDRVAERWNDGEFNVGTITDIKEEEGTQYLVKWDYSDGPDSEWLYGDALTQWIEESLNEATIHMSKTQMAELDKEVEEATKEVAKYKIPMKAQKNSAGETINNPDFDSVPKDRRNAAKSAYDRYKKALEARPNKAKNIIVYDESINEDIDPSLKSRITFLKDYFEDYYELMDFIDMDNQISDELDNIDDDDDKYEFAINYIAKNWDDFYFDDDYDTWKEIHESPNEDNSNVDIIKNKWDEDQDEFGYIDDERIYNTIAEYFNADDIECWYWQQDYSGDRGAKLVIETVDGDIQYFEEHGGSLYELDESEELNEGDNMNKVMNEATGYDWMGNPESVKDWDNNFVTTKTIVWDNASDGDGETYDLEEMDKEGLYDPNSDTITIPRGTKLIYDDVDTYGSVQWACYLLPEYNNVRIRILYDYWKWEFSKMVAVPMSDKQKQARLDKIAANKAQKELENSRAMYWITTGSITKSGYNMGWGTRWTHSSKYFLCSRGSKDNLIKVKECSNDVNSKFRIAFKTATDAQKYIDKLGITAKVEQMPDKYATKYTWVPVEDLDHNKIFITSEAADYYYIKTSVTESKKVFDDYNKSLNISKKLNEKRNAPIPGQISIFDDEEIQSKENPKKDEETVWKKLTRLHPELLDDDYDDDMDESYLSESFDDDGNNEDIDVNCEGCAKLMKAPANSEGPYYCPDCVPTQKNESFIIMGKDDEGFKYYNIDTDTWSSNINDGKRYDSLDVAHYDFYEITPKYRDKFKRIFVPTFED